jgi:hypothetical protein
MGREHCGSVKSWQVDRLFECVGVKKPCRHSFENWVNKKAQIPPRVLRGVMEDNGLTFADVESGGVTIIEKTQRR